MKRFILKSHVSKFGELYFLRALHGALDWTSFPSMAASYETEEDAIRAAHALGIHRSVTAVAESNELVAAMD